MILPGHAENRRARRSKVRTRSLQYDFQVSLGEDTVYSVVVFEYPAGKGPNPDTDTYVKLVNAYAKGSETRACAREARRPSTAARASRRSADDNKGKLSHLIDVVPAGDRIYMLVTAGPKGHATSDDAERFRNSFRLLGDEPMRRAHRRRNASAQ